MEILKLEGRDQSLFYLLAPLVMDENILNYNLNYPYRTSTEYLWFIAREQENTIGFIPVKREEGKAVVNNYYVKDDDSVVFSVLLKELRKTLLPDFEIEAVAQIRHIPDFERIGFVVVHRWKRYVKMKILENEKERI